MNFIEHADHETLQQAVTDEIAKALGAAIDGSGRASLAVAGGSTPGPVFDRLSGVDLDWSKVTIMPTDERWVPEASDVSNAKLIRARLLQDKASRAQYASLFHTGRSAEDHAPILAESLHAHLPLTVAFLGMGGDMHTASLFPGHMASDPETYRTAAPPVIAVRQKGLPAAEERISLTPPVLNAAGAKVLMITGSEKRAALEAAQRLNDAKLAPVVAVLHEMSVHWAE